MTKFPSIIPRSIKASVNFINFAIKKSRYSNFIKKKKLRMAIYIQIKYKIQVKVKALDKFSHNNSSNPTISRASLKYQINYLLTSGKSV